MEKRVWLYLCVVLLLLLPSGGLGTGAVTSGGYDYTLAEDGSAVIAKYKGSATDVSIPDDLDGHKVSGIGQNAFVNCRDITNVIIPKGVVSIGGYAFSRCVSLVSVSIPEGVTNIGGDAFSQCDSLVQIKIPDSVTVIGESAFGKCALLTKITVSAKNPAFVAKNGVLIEKETKTLHTYPAGLNAETYDVQKGITAIKGYAFFGCARLKSVRIPEGVKNIGRNAFSYCDSLEKVSIPSDTTYIGSGVFNNCAKLSDIRVASENAVFEAADGVLYTKTPKALVTYPAARAAQEYVIPDGTVTICSEAFAYCQNLKSVTIPESVTNVESSAFAFCTGLTAIRLPKGITSIGGSTFYTCSSLTAVEIPDTVVEIGLSAFRYCESLSSLAVPASVLSIGDNAFSDCANLTLTVADGSYAMRYAKEKGIKFVVAGK